MSSNRHVLTFDGDLNSLFLNLRLARKFPEVAFVFNFTNSHQLVESVLSKNPLQKLYRMFVIRFLAGRFSGNFI